MCIRDRFCTNPGLVMAAEGPDLTRFLGAATEALGGVPAQTMLTPGILKAYQEGIGKLAANKRVEKVAEGQIASGDTQGQAAIFATKAEDFIADPSMEEEVFGAASLVIRCQEVEKMKEMAEKLEGQLTATVLMEPEDMDFARALLPILERRVGRILINGFPTGVEVSHAMVHGGPYPSTSDGRTTSVGTLAIRRFLRPVCYQDFPAELLPEALRDGNPLGLWRRIDGALGKN